MPAGSKSIPPLLRIDLLTNPQNSERDSLASLAGGSNHCPPLRYGLLVAGSLLHRPAVHRRFAPQAARPSPQLAALVFRLLGWCRPSPRREGVLHWEVGKGEAVIGCAVEGVWVAGYGGVVAEVVRRACPISVPVGWWRWGEPRAYCVLGASIAVNTARNH